MKDFLCRLNPAESILQNIKKTIRKSLHNMNSAVLLNAIRKGLKITKRKPFRINYGKYQTLFENNFIFGN